MIDETMSNKMAKYASVFLLVVCVALIVSLFFVNKSKRETISMYTSRCDRLAIVQLDALIVKNGIPQPGVSLKNTFREVMDAFRYTDSCLLLKYRLNAVGDGLELVDYKGDVVAAVASSGKTTRMRGIGDLQDFPK